MNPLAFHPRGTHYNLQDYYVYLIIVELLLTTRHYAHLEIKLYHATNAERNVCAGGQISK